MKVKIGIMLLLAVNVLGQPRLIPSRAVFVVRDDKGDRVGGVFVDGGFGEISNRGARDFFKGYTDNDGMFVAEGKTLVDVGARFEKKGYYSTITNVPLSYELSKNITRWDIEIPVILKKIRNPIPMYVKRFYNPHISVFEDFRKYNLGKTSQYDFVKADFLPPYGKGEVGDMRALWEMKIYKTNAIGRAIDCDTYCEISFTNCVDGICRGKPEGDRSFMNGSEFISAYEAPLEGYTNKVIFYSKTRGIKRETNDDNHQLYYFRIRTQVDKDGRITNAIYGKIYGELKGVLTYYLNPVPNDRNMEYDGKNNLFTDQKKEKYLP